MNLEPGRNGAHPRGTLLWLWNPAESSSTFAEVSAWSDLCMDKCCLWPLLVEITAISSWLPAFACFVILVVILFAVCCPSRLFLPAFYVHVHSLDICHGYLCGIQLDHLVQLGQGECKLCKLCILLNVLAVCSVMSRLLLCSHTILRLCMSWPLFVEYDWIISTLTRWVLGLNSWCSVLPFAVASGNHCHFSKLTSGQSTLVAGAHLCIVDQPWWNVKTSVSLQSLVELLCRSRGGLTLQ